MYVRCPDCHTSSRVAISREKQGTICGACGRGYSLSRAGELGSIPQERYERALAYSEENQIDLASAYSVLLGILTLEVARTVSGLDVPAKEEATEAEPVPTTKLHTATEAMCLTYDEGFDKAISDGCLTPAQAMQRGDRVVFASRVAQKHDLSMHMAFLVADNRLSLSAARRKLRDRDAKETAVHRSASSMSPRRVGAILGIAGAFLFALAIRGWDARDNDGQSNPEGLEITRAAIVRLAESPEIRTDHQGQVIEVSGRNPLSVLNAYCRANAPTITLQPVRLAPSSPPSPSIQMGLFRDHGKSGSLHAIKIQKEGRLWIAGTGDGPILVR